MSRLAHHNDPLVSTLKEGIVIGVIAALRHHQLSIDQQQIAIVLREQQGFSEDEISYFLNWLSIFNIGQ